MVNSYVKTPVCTGVSVFAPPAIGGVHAFYGVFQGCPSTGKWHAQRTHPGPPAHAASAQNMYGLTQTTPPAECPVAVARRSLCHQQDEPHISELQHGNFQRYSR